MLENETFDFIRFGKNSAKKLYLLLVSSCVTFFKCVQVEIPIGRFNWHFITCSHFVQARMQDTLNMFVSQMTTNKTLLGHINTLHKLKKQLFFEVYIGTRMQMSRKWICFCLIDSYRSCLKNVIRSKSKSKFKVIIKSKTIVGLTKKVPFLGSISLWTMKLKGSFTKLEEMCIDTVVVKVIRSPKRNSKIQLNVKWQLSRHI